MSAPEGKVHRRPDVERIQREAKARYIARPSAVAGLCDYILSLERSLEVTKSDCAEAFAENERLRAKLAAAEKALEPFARWGAKMVGTAAYGDTWPLTPTDTATVGNLRNDLAALKQIRGE